MQHQLLEQSFTFEAFDWTPECESAYHHTTIRPVCDGCGGSGVQSMPVVLAGKSFPFSPVRSLIMSGLVEHVTRWENAQLEAIFNEEPKCEHSAHGRDDVHDGGPATHYQVGRGCSHSNGLRCATWVAFATKFPDWIRDCPVCGMPFDSFFIEL